MNVFNSQSEAILVVKKNNLEDNEEDQRKSNEGDCLFCNSKSQELFGIDLSSPIQTDEQR